MADPTRPSQLRIRLTQDLIDRFVALTGDVSSLHVDDSFARRSAYRQPVVHGMLPLAFLGLVAPTVLGGRRVTMKGLSGRFAGPAFRDDTLVLSVSTPGAGGPGDETTLEYRVTRDGPGEVITIGAVTMAERAGDPPTRGRAGASPSGLLTETPALQEHRLADISVGQQEHALQFCVGPGALAAFMDLLRVGVDGAAEIPSDLDATDLLAHLLFSTSVGVSLPGASATFIDFSSRIVSHLSPEVLYRLEGTVTHRSKATGIIKKALRVVTADGSGEPLIEGKVSTLVNEPARRMPTMRELADESLDLGLKDKVVLITGASRGIGETTAKLFALWGAKVVVNYHRGEADANRVVREIVEGGGAATAVQADVSDVDAVKRLVRTAVERYGAIDVLVNNAAKDFRPIPFAKLRWEDVQSDIDVILKGAFLCCQEVIPIMVERGGGSIINLSTVATENPPPDQLKYVVAKSALNGLTRSLAADFAARNVRVNMVVPSFVETDLVAHVRTGFRQRIADEVPMGRLSSPAEVARAIVFLASAYSSYTTGQKVMVTGGSPPLL